MTKIVILGGGFAGITLALGLEKVFKSLNNVRITLMDKEPYHLFNGNLYEVATAAEELVDLKQLKKSITLPFAQIVADKKISFIQSEAQAVDASLRLVSLGGKKIEYDYLVLALGSCEECFNIAGAKEYGIPLKSLPHAFKIKNAIEFAIEAHKYDAQKQYVRVVVAGGGYTGVELAAELTGLFNYLAWKHQYPRHKIELEIVEAGNTLMPGMGERASRDALKRLSQLDIKVKLLSPIAKVEHSMLELLTRERLVYDVLIWTAGVRAKNLPAGLNFKIDARGRVETDEFLRIKGQDKIFAMGDQALVLQPGGRSVPQSAQDAIHQAQYLALALPVLMKNHRPAPYQPKPHGFIVTLGGKWAILNYPPFYFKGRLAYFIHTLAHLRYFASLLGFWKAIKLVWFQDKLYERND